MAEQFGQDQSPLQEEQVLSQSGYTGCSSVDIVTEMPHSSTSPDVSKER